VQKWFKISAADMIVRDRVVHFCVCDDQSKEERRALRVAAENIAAVRRVEEHIVPAAGSRPFSTPSEKLYL
jgi:hypothetical protein